MKKLLSLLLAAMLLFSLTACGGGGAEESAPSIVESGAPSDTPADPDSIVEGDNTDGKTTTSGRSRTTTQGRGKTTASNGEGKTTSTTTAKPNGSTTAKPTDTDKVPTKDLPLIICWGDSITEGAWMQKGDSYPSQLQEMVGADNYKVWNAGYGGDGSYAIGARQGAYKLSTKNDITFKKGQSTVIIGHRQTGMGLMLDDGTELTKLNVNKLNSSSSDWKYYLNANPVTIGGATYKLGLTYETEEKPYTDGKYSVTLIRSDTSKELTIPAGTAVKLANSDLAANDHCDVYLMGANDGLGNSPSATQVAGLVARYKKLVDSRKNDRYLIIIPFWTKNYDAAFKEAFGDHAINFRELAVAHGLQTEGLTATVKDQDLIKSGNVPSSLRYGNQGTEQVHLNKYGYHFMATVVYEQGQKLGYWK